MLRRLLRGERPLEQIDALSGVRTTLKRGKGTESLTIHMVRSSPLDGGLNSRVPKGPYGRVPKGPMVEHLKVLNSRVPKGPMVERLRSLSVEPLTIGIVSDP